MHQSEEVWSIQDQVNSHLNDVKKPEYFISLNYAHMQIFLIKESTNQSSSSLLCNLPTSSLNIPLSGYIPVQTLESKINKIDQGKTKISQCEPNELSDPHYDYIVTCDKALRPYELELLKQSQEKKFRGAYKAKLDEQIATLTALSNKKTQEEFYDQLDVAFSNTTNNLAQFIFEPTQGIHPFFQGTFLLNGSNTVFYPSPFNIDPVFYAFTSPQEVKAMSPLEKEMHNSQNTLSIALNELATQILPIYVLDEQLKRIIPLIDKDQKHFQDTPLEKIIDDVAELYMNIFIHTQSLTHQVETAKKSTIDLCTFYGIETNWINFQESAKDIVSHLKSGELANRFTVVLDK